MEWVGFISPTWEWQNPVTWLNLAARERNVIFLVPRKRENEMEFDEHVSCLRPGKGKYPKENGGVDTKIREKGCWVGFGDLLFSPSLQTLPTCPAQPASHGHGSLRPDAVQRGDPAGHALHSLPASGTSLWDTFLQ